MNLRAPRSRKRARAYGLAAGIVLFLALPFAQAALPGPRPAASRPPASQADQPIVPRPWLAHEAPSLPVARDAGEADGLLAPLERMRRHRAWRALGPKAPRATERMQVPASSPKPRGSSSQRAADDLDRRAARLVRWWRLSRAQF